MKYAQKPNQVRNQWNGSTYSLDTFEPIITKNTKYTINSQGQKERYDRYLTRKAYALPKKQFVRNPWNGDTYSFESYEPDSREEILYDQGFVKYKDGNYYNINNHQALNPYTGATCIFK